MRAIPPLLVAISLPYGLISCGGDEKVELASPEETEVATEDNTGAPALSLELRIAEDVERHISEGADPDKTYMIEHHLAASELKTAREIAAWGKENGFTPVFDESTVVKGEWINVDLLKESKLEVTALWRDATGITSLAERLMCEYEGWGFWDAP